MNLSNKVVLAMLVFGAAVGCAEKQASTGGAAAPSATSVTVVEAASASTAPASSDALGAILASATSAHVSWLGPKPNNGNDVDVTDANELATIVLALGPSQSPTNAMSRCMTPTTLSFKDAKGATVASVGLCDTPGLAANNQSQARLDRPSARPTGLEVKDLAALRIALGKKGVVLP